MESNHPPITCGELIEVLKQVPSNKVASFLCPDGYEDAVSGVDSDGTMIGYGRAGNLYPVNKLGHSPAPIVPCDTPLTAQIECDQLVIRIGIDTLAFAAEHCPRFYDYEKNPEPPYVKVVDKEELAHDIVRELLREEEDGTTPLCVLFDDAFVAAFEDGSLGFYDDGA